MQLLFWEQKLYIYLSIYSTDEISLNKVATQSHTHKGDSYPAHNAVDRNTRTCMSTRDIGTSSNNKTVWWKVDLGGVYSIYSVTILFKNYKDFCMLFFKCRFDRLNCFILKLLQSYFLMLLLLMFTLLEPKK